MSEQMREALSNLGIRIKADEKFGEATLDEIENMLDAGARKLVDRNTTVRCCLDLVMSDRMARC